MSDNPTKPKRLTVGSLFAGIGGFDLGFERAGFETVWQVEIDDYCRRVLERHFPRAERFGDIRGCGAHNLKPVDVICGGFPCQPFSSAGRRLGTADDRHLWPEMLRVISALRPDFVVAENVAGFIALEDGRILDKVYADLEGEGYELLPPIMVPAASFGAWHRRDRIWICAHSLRGSGSTKPQQQQNERAEVAGGVCADGSNTEGERCGEARADSVQSSERVASICDAQDVANAAGIRCGPWRPKSERFIGSTGASNGSALNGHATIAGLPDWAGGEMGQPSPLTEFERPGGREIERDFRGMAHGVSRRVDRLRGLGNAVVPQIAQWIAERIKESLTREVTTEREPVEEKDFCDTLRARQRRREGGEMRTKKVNRYYCDFCRKAGMSKFWIAKHEKGCTANPGRVCGLCEHSGNEQKPISDLMGCLSFDKGEYGMPELRTAAGGCPACILAAIRQRKLQSREDWAEDGPIDYKFDFKAEMQLFWDQTNDANLS